jgi:hypothetical protein
MNPGAEVLPGGPGAALTPDFVAGPDRIDRAGCRKIFPGPGREPLPSSLGAEDFGEGEARQRPEAIAGRGTLPEVLARFGGASPEAPPPREVGLAGQDVPPAGGAIPRRKRHGLGLATNRPTRRGLGPCAGDRDLQLSPFQMAIAAAIAASRRCSSSAQGRSRCCQGGRGGGGGSGGGGSGMHKG